MLELTETIPVKGDSAFRTRNNSAEDMLNFCHELYNSNLFNILAPSEREVVEAAVNRGGGKSDTIQRLMNQYAHHYVY